MQGVLTTVHQRRWLTRIVVAVFVAAFIVAATQETFLSLGIIQRLELAAIDFRFRFRGTNHAVKESPHVVIVEISEDSFKSLPERFPWPRSYYAHVARNLKAAGAKVVGIDLIFSGSDNYDPANDEILRKAIRETGIVVLAGKREEDSPMYVKSSGLEDFGNMFFPGDSSMGLVNIRTDADGVYRFYNASYIVDAGGGSQERIPTYGFAVLNRYFGYPPLTSPQSADDAFTYGGRVIPKYDPESMMINFYGPSGTFPHIKFHDVIDDDSFTTVEEASTGQKTNTFSDPSYGYLYDGTFKDKIVLIGVTVPEYKDLFPVSMGHGKLRGDNLMYGVEIHANIIENIIRNDFLKKQSPLSETLTVLFLSFGIFFLIAFIRSAKTRHSLMIEGLAMLCTGAILLTIFLASLYLFTAYNYVFTVVGPIFAVIGGYGASTTYHFISERRQRVLIKAMFSTYVNPSVVDELISNPAKLTLGGQRRELTVLFSDIEGFTRLSQELPPEGLVRMLNEYLSVMSNIIFKNDGTLDKYEGDAVMAFWGAPIPQNDHALRACRSALQMQTSLVDVNNYWREHDKPTLSIRIGIHTGEMVVGNMGASGKFAYTVIGDSVNLASRLEGANKEYKTGIMVSQRTYELVKSQILGRELDRITVKGRTEPVTTYELIQMLDEPVDPSLEQFLSFYNEAMLLYYGMRWREACEQFQECLRIRPADYPSQLHIARALAYQASPPPTDWNGVFVMLTK